MQKVGYIRQHPRIRLLDSVFIFITFAPNVTHHRHFPGSFDPFTRGHQALVDDALRIFDKVVIGIGNNVSKAGLLRIEARKQLIEDLYADNPRVEVRIYTGLTGDFARDQHASAIIRGVRNTTDFEYERTMEATNHRLHPDIITVMLFTPAPVADIASSTVREVLAFGRTVDEFMPEGIDIKIPLITILL